MAALLQEQPGVAEGAVERFVAPFASRVDPKRDERCPRVEDDRLDFVTVPGAQESNL
jgi:hypothetical protein